MEWPVPHRAFQTLVAGRMARHRHGHGYAAIVMSGGYLEAGDRGRFDARPGHVLLHGPWESHMDAVSSAGAKVMNLPLVSQPGFAVGRLADVDAVVRIAHRDLVEAALTLAAELEPMSAALNDWPDQLAQALRADAGMSLGAWARRRGLAPETVSRGFRQAFGTSPKRYRAEQRALRAAGILAGGGAPLAPLAVDMGFSDQAHMTRAVRALTGQTPRQLSVNSVQSDPEADR